MSSKPATAGTLPPPPMTPPDCDLRGYDWMPLFGHRLFGSDLYAEATDEEFRAALRLWWHAWQQCPAASLPNSPRALAEAAGYGRQVDVWETVSLIALRGFVLCSDGRLYHPLLAEAAIPAFERRKADRARKRRERASQRKKGTEEQEAAAAVGNQRSPLASEPARPRNAVGNNPAVTSSNVPTRARDVRRTGEGRGADRPAPVRRESDREREKERVTDSFGIGARSDGDGGGDPSEDWLWTQGMKAIARLTNASEGSCYKILSLMLEAASDDDQRAEAVLREGERTRPENPGTWLVRACGSIADDDHRWSLVKEIDAEAARASSVTRALSAPIQQQAHESEE